MMAEKLHWRVQVLAWGNIVLAGATIIGLIANLLSALQVFSVEWSQGSIVLAVLFGGTLACLTGSSGWAVLKNRPGAFKLSCIAGGLTIGYAGAGILIMLTFGLDRTLEILVRHGSENWWNWSLSRFQHSVLRETPVLAWWILCFGTLVRLPVGGAPDKMRDRLSDGFVLAACLSLVGGIARFIQLAQDTLLSSQR